MSTRRGPPAHQNAIQWVPNRADKHNSLQKFVSEIKIDRVCRRCHDQIEWKRTYGKYKPLKQPAKCVGCSQKTVHQAYHNLCQVCCEKRKVCAKCMEGEVLEEDTDEAKAAADVKLIEDAMAFMSERDRRTAKRKIANGEDLSSLLAAAKGALTVIGPTPLPTATKASRPAAAAIPPPVDPTHVDVPTLLPADELCAPDAATGAQEVAAARSSSDACESDEQGTTVPPLQTSVMAVDAPRACDVPAGVGAESHTEAVAATAKELAASYLY